MINTKKGAPENSTMKSDGLQDSQACRRLALAHIMRRPFKLKTSPMKLEVAK